MLKKVLYASLAGLALAGNDTATTAAANGTAASPTTVAVNGTASNPTTVAANGTAPNPTTVAANPTTVANVNGSAQNPTTVAGALTTVGAVTTGPATTAGAVTTAGGAATTVGAETTTVVGSEEKNKMPAAPEKPPARAANFTAPTLAKMQQIEAKLETAADYDSAVLDSCDSLCATANVNAIANDVTFVQAMIDVSVAIISKVPTRCKATGLPSTEYDECMFRVAPTFTGAAKMATCCTFDAATGLFKKKARRVLAASKRDLAAVSTTFKDAPKLVIAEPANATVLTNKLTKAETAVKAASFKTDAATQVKHVAQALATGGTDATNMLKFLPTKLPATAGNAAEVVSIGAAIGDSTATKLPAAAANAVANATIAVTVTVTKGKATAPPAASTSSTSGAVQAAVGVAALLGAVMLV